MCKKNRNFIVKEIAEKFVDTELGANTILIIR